MRAINWKLGVRRLYLVGLVPYLAGALLIASDTPTQVQTFLILCVVRSPDTACWRGSSGL
jgi:hypothetical protein